jgi:hypothetical protein
MRCYRFSTHREPRVRPVQSLIYLRTLSTSDFRCRDISSAIEWSSALRLATRWDINSIQSLAGRTPFARHAARQARPRARARYPSLARTGVRCALSA